MKGRVRYAIDSMPCEEKDRLVKLYQAILERYLESIENLNLSCGGTSVGFSRWTADQKLADLQEDFEHLRATSEYTWASAETLRVALEGHIGTHEC